MALEPPGVDRLALARTAAVAAMRQGPYKKNPLRAGDPEVCAPLQ